jgi:cytochrome c-type biogenesis protein CcmH/NrfG
MTKLTAMVNPNQVTSLIKELLILNRIERTLAAYPPSPEQVEQWESQRKRIRQELVQALSRQKHQQEILVMQNHIKQ